MFLSYVSALIPSSVISACRKRRRDTSDIAVTIESLQADICNPRVSCKQLYDVFRRATHLGKPEVECFLLWMNGILKEFDDSPSVLNKTFICLNFLIMDIEYDLLISKENVSLIVTTLQVQMRNVSVIKPAYLTVQNISTNDDIAVRLIEKGIIPVIIAGLRHYESDSYMSLFILAALWSLSMNEQGMEYFCEQGGIQIIVNLMKHHPTNTRILISSCGILLNSTTNDANDRSMRNTDILGVLKTVIQTHSLNVSLMIQACTVICSIVDDPTNLRLVSESEIIYSIVTLLKQHMHTNETMVCCALDTLTIFAQDATNYRILIAQELIEDMSCAIRLYKTNAKVMKAMCDMLKTPFSSDDMMKLRNECFIHELVALTQLHENDIDVMRSASRAFLNFAKYVDNREVLKQANAIKVLRSMLKVHETSSDVAINASGALLYLSFIDASAIKPISVEDGHILYLVMRMHENKLDLMMMACETLYHISLKDYNDIHIKNCHLIDALRTVMGRHRRHVALVGRACDFVRNIALSEVLKTDLNRSDLISEFRSILKLHSRHTHIVASAKEALAKLEYNAITLL